MDQDDTDGLREFAIDVKQLINRANNESKIKNKNRERTGRFFPPGDKNENGKQRPQGNRDPIVTQQADVRQYQPKENPISPPGEPIAMAQNNFQY